MGPSGRPLELPPPRTYVEPVAPPSADDERFEHIPWEQLAPNGDRPKVIMYALAGAVGVAALTAALVRGSGAATDPVPPPSTVAPATTGVTTPATPTPPVPSTTLTGIDDQSGRSWSEADLMAFSPESLSFQAGNLAEWIASDFFTIDGGTEITEDLGEMLPKGSALPAAPPGSRSYVEWSRAISVEESAPGVYEALVVVRRLGAGAGEEYRRMPTLAVIVTLAWTDQGWSVVDLPVLAEAPPLVQKAEWFEAEVPDVIASAVEAATGGIVTSGAQVGDNWRVVVAIDDPAGASWPMVVWSDPAGNRISSAGQRGQP